MPRIESRERVEYRQLCHSLDSTTLLALLPELRVRMGQAEKLLKEFTDWADEDPEGNAAVFEALNEAAVAWDRRRDENPDAVAKMQAHLAAMRASAEGDARAAAARSSEAILAALEWATACSMNIRTIEEELESRRLLPGFPRRDSSGTASTDSPVG